MKLVVVHYHLRPGGVRRVIELATPHLVRESRGAIRSVVVATGEKPDANWERVFRRLLAGTTVEFFVEPAFNYLFEQTVPVARIRQKIRAGLAAVLGGGQSGGSLVWAHNPGVGRNLLLSAELAQLGAAGRVPVLLHHHDWWFDNRWHRWPEIRRAGFRTLKAVARAIFPAAPSVRHLAINRFDAAKLRHGFSRSAVWLPNLAENHSPPPPARIRRTRAWLPNVLPGRPAPVWILPCRALRRKNLAEALLLARWLRPEAWLVTTGGASSAGERPYFDRLAAAIRQNGWRMRLGILQGDETGKPTVAELLVASEAVLLSSIQEGFGLPYLEAAAARRPLIARAIPNIAPDLRRLGFKFPQCYGEILIDPRLFDWVAEQKRQLRLFQSWRRALPRPVREFAGRPQLLREPAEPRPVPFSRLTLTAQLEILAQPVEFSWGLCARLNPFLKTWRKRAQTGHLQHTSWPRRADQWLSGPAYARRFMAAAGQAARHAPPPDAGEAIQSDFLRAKLDEAHLFPLLWAADT